MSTPFAKLHQSVCCKWLLVCISMLFMWHPEDKALAGTSNDYRSLFEQLTILRFANERMVTAREGFIDLSELGSEELWHIRGTALFVPEVFITYSDLQGQALSSIQAKYEGIPVGLNPGYYSNDLKGSNATWGSFIFKFHNPGERQLKLDIRYLYHPSEIFIFDEKRSIPVARYKSLSTDPNENANYRAHRDIEPTITPQGDFYLVLHVSAPLHNGRSTLNVSDIFIGEQEYLSAVLHQETVLGSMIGGIFLVIGIYYSFVFLVRREDISSLFLSSFAICSFTMWFLYHIEIQGVSVLGRSYAAANLAGITFLTLYILHKLSPFAKGRWFNYLKIYQIGLPLITLVTFVSGLRSIANILIFVLYTSWVLFPLFAIYCGLKHKMDGILPFCMGVFGHLVFQLNVAYHIISGDQWEMGYNGLLSNLSMTIALGLVNAKEFASTYRRAVKHDRMNQALLKEVQEKEKARTTFFHNTSHELRTPLNGLISFLQLLSRENYGIIPEAAKQQILKCERLAQSLKLQVNTILDLAKSQKGQLSISNTLVSLNDFVRDMQDLMEGLTHRTGEQHYRIEADLRGLDQQIVIDREKLYTIARNLLGNAFKFSDPSRLNEVQLSIRRLPKSMILEVRDTGIGIPEDQQQHIFEEFRQVQGDARRAYEGTGLGLTMVRDLVQLLGGQLHLQSKLNEGSCFQVELPEGDHVEISQAARETTDTMTTQKQLPEVSVTSLSPDIITGAGQILVVDDNEINCEVLRDLLLHAGYDVDISYNGHDALKKLNQKLPDLVLLDLMMPFMSGEDVLIAIRADASLANIPVILVTARASDDDRLLGLSLGADDYLAKPIHHEELLFRVRNVIEGRRKSFALGAEEEDQRLIQLGELMSDFSHELKNALHSESLTKEQIETAREIIFSRMPLPPNAMQTLLPALRSGLPSIDRAFNQDSLDYPNEKMRQDRILRLLRFKIAGLKIAEEDKHAFWQHCLKLDESDRTAIFLSMALIFEERSMREQLRYTRDLVYHILDYSRQDKDESHCSLQRSLQRVQALLSVKLKQYQIDWQSELMDTDMAISETALMQCFMNLCSNAIEAISDLEAEQRWIRITSAEQPESVEIRVENGGPPIAAGLTKKLFQRKISRNEGKSKSYGLGLDITRRMILRATGSIFLDESREHPCFVMILPKFYSESNLNQSDPKAS